MRSISLVQKLEVDYKGSVFKNAICLADIDDDGSNELCVGFTNGDLHAYKGLIRLLNPFNSSRGLRHRGEWNIHLDWLKNFYNVVARVWVILKPKEL